MATVTTFAWVRADVDVDVVPVSDIDDDDDDDDDDNDDDDVEDDEFDIPKSYGDEEEACQGSILPPTSTSFKGSAMMMRPSTSSPPSGSTRCLAGLADHFSTSSSSASLLSKSSTSSDDSTLSTMSSSAHHVVVVDMDGTPTNGGDIMPNQNLAITGRRSVRFADQWMATSSSSSDRMRWITMVESDLSQENALEQQDMQAMFYHKKELKQFRKTAQRLAAMQARTVQAAIHKIYYVACSDEAVALCPHLALRPKIDKWNLVQCFQLLSHTAVRGMELSVYPAMLQDRRLAQQAVLRAQFQMMPPPMERSESARLLEIAASVVDDERLLPRERDPNIPIPSPEERAHILARISTALSDQPKRVSRLLARGDALLAYQIYNDLHPDDTITKIAVPTKVPDLAIDLLKKAKAKHNKAATVRGKTKKETAGSTVNLSHPSGKSKNKKKKTPSKNSSTAENVTATVSQAVASPSSATAADKPRSDKKIKSSKKVSSISSAPTSNTKSKDKPVLVDGSTSKLLHHNSNNATNTALVASSFLPLTKTPSLRSTQAAAASSSTSSTLLVVECASATKARSRGAC